MSRFIMPRQGVKGQNLTPADGAKLHFKVIGQGVGGTNKATFTVESLTTGFENTNPVIADSKGLFEEIWLDGDYDVFLTDKNDIPKWGPEKVNSLVTGSAASQIETKTTSTMTGLSGLVAGVSVISTAEFADGNGGGGVYDAVLTSSVTTNTFNIIIGVADNLISFVLRIEDGPLNVKQWGATGDGSTDDQPAIQAAVDFAIASTDPFKAVWFPGDSNYAIGSEIDRSGNGVYVDLFGDGRRNTLITAIGSSFPNMIKLAVFGNIAIHTTIRDMSLDCAGIADQAIDASIMRYWTLNNVEIKNAVLQCATVGNWVGRIFNNRFASSPIGLLIKGSAAASSAQNNFVVELNDFNTCPVGLKVEDKSNDITITENAFDLCDDVAIWINKGGRNIDIVHNYFERCGFDGTVNGSVDVLIAGATTEAIGAAIIVGYDPTAVTTSTWEGIIKNNEWANCNTDRLIAVYNVREGEISNNPHHDGSGSSAALVDIRQEGVNTSNGRKLVVKGNYATSVVTKLVALNGLDPETDQSNIVIDYQDTPSAMFPKFFVNDPSSILAGWTGAAPAVTNYGGFQELEFTGGATDRILLLDFTTLTDHPLLGRYVRLHYATKGSASSTGVRCRISISGVEIVDVQRSGTTYTEAGRGMVFEIPTTATSFQIRLDALSGANDSKMIGFCVCDASYDIHEVPIQITL